MIKRYIAVLLTIILLIPLTTAAAYAAPDYADVPEDSWAKDTITAAYDYGLMQGSGGSFGYGRSISRAEFVTVLARMFSWDIENYDGDNLFSDISSHWAKDYINAAALNGAVTGGGSFRPNDAITRREMAVMLVNALGYGDIAATASSYSLPFTDVAEDKGYIVVAYDIGLTNGITETSFAPEDTATREQAAAMLVRVYERFMSDTKWTHAFYAISSYSQIGLSQNFDAISLGWCSMALTEDAVPYLNTEMSSSTYYIPASYASVIEELESYNVKLHLSVYMDTVQKIGEDSAISMMLSDEEKRTAAVDVIMDELTRDYPDLGYNPYSGVTIDFEGLRSGLKEDFSLFLSKLKASLDEQGMTLYVTVMPATADGIYFDGYDYRAIGDVADKVILMAHDYGAKNLSGFLNSTYYKNTALTPLSSVYCSLHAICDGSTGVQDKEKITLAVSLGSLAWRLDENGLLANELPLVPTHETIHTRLTGGAVMGWSDTYRNPYLTYTTEDGQNIFLWYEDERSVSEKVSLAKMFGIESVSVWRLGLIPDYDDEGIYYNVLDALK